MRRPCARRARRVRTALAARRTGRGHRHLDHLVVHPCGRHRGAARLSRQGDASLPLRRSGSVWRLRLPAHRSRLRNDDSKPPASPNSSSGWPASLEPCGWTTSPATRAVWAGAPGSGWASTAPDNWDSGGIDRTRLELVDHCPIACDPVMETGTFDANWAGVDELEIIVAPDTGESLIAVDLSRKAARRHCRRCPPASSSTGAPSSGRAPCTRRSPV